MAGGSLTLILGNQLHRQWFSPSPLQLGPDDTVLMVEDLGVASAYRYHRLRLLHTFCAMRCFRDALVERGLRVRYFELPDSQELPFAQRLQRELGAALPRFRCLRVSEIPDRTFRQWLIDLCAGQGVTLEELPSPAFLEAAADSRRWFSGRARPRMQSFYQRQRQRLGLLLEADGSPVGGRWSFDADNRRRLPKDYREPPLPPLTPCRHEPAVRALVEQHFPEHPGALGPLYLPVDQPAADAWLGWFLSERLDGFGPYEDAISRRFDTVQHSLLSPLLNIGLLDPAGVIAATLEHAAQRERAGTPVPIASLEGFIRQVIGWREFVRGIDLVHGERQAQANHWGHRRRLAPCWNDGSTGLPPLDRTIERVNRLAYNHHIERLMVISNLMLLCEIHPAEVHRWFMERYIDSYEWVMGPNVYGMGLMSDGGMFATKPYICGSNYIRKMGDDTAGPWCDIWDGLYWRFIDRHRDFFSANPRLSMMVRLLDRMADERRQRLFSVAEAFIERVTLLPAA